MAEQWRKYYLVAIPEGEIAERGNALQRYFSQKYGVYREPYPPLHLTVGILCFPPGRLAEITRRLAGVIGPRLPLELFTLGESCFPAPDKSINLAVEQSPALLEIFARVAETVEAAGCEAESFDQWDYHISLVNCNIFSCWRVS